MSSSFRGCYFSSQAKRHKDPQESPPSPAKTVISLCPGIVEMRAQVSNDYGKRSHEWYTPGGAEEFIHLVEVDVFLHLRHLLRNLFLLRSPLASCLEHRALQDHLPGVVLRAFQFGLICLAALSHFGSVSGVVAASWFDRASVGFKNPFIMFLLAA